MDEQTDATVAKRYGAPPGSGDAGAEQRSTTRRRLLIGLVVVGVIVAAVLFAHPWKGKHATSSFAPPPQAVATAIATTGEMPVTMNALGTVTPIAAVTVQPRVSGELMRVGFREGQMVEKGQFLAEIDPRPYQVALEQAEGQLAHDTALLHQAESDLARYQKLKRQNSIAEQQVADQGFLVQQYQGTVKTDQAAIDSAKLNLAYCSIAAPIAGRVGLRQIDPGNYVQSGADPNGIVVITQLHPISVLFTLPQKDIAEVSKAMATKTPLPVTAYDSAGTSELATGQLTAMDNQINVSTGTVQLRADFANQRGTLFPNEFVNARLLVRTLHGAVLVPRAAIQRGAPGTFVYLVGAGDTVAVRKVVLGPGDASNVSIVAGLAAGDRVVTEGADRLRPGAKVSVVANTTQGASPADPPPQPGSKSLP